MKIPKIYQMKGNKKHIFENPKIFNTFLSPQKKINLVDTYQKICLQSSFAMKQIYINEILMQ